MTNLNFWQWLALLFAGLLVYSALPERVRVPYLALVVLGGLVASDRFGGLARLKQTYNGLVKGAGL